MTRTTANMKVALGAVLCAVVCPAMAQVPETAAGNGPPQTAAPNDPAGFAAVQAKYEQLRRDGRFPEELTYYYSESVPVLDPKNGTMTGTTSCQDAIGAPGQPRFLYGGLDPYALIERAESDRRDFPVLDAPYANFFAASRSDLGRCENSTVLAPPTGSTAQYVLLFKSSANKARFDAELVLGVAPMPAVGFWCMWGLGNGTRPHFAAPNNPQFVVYQLDRARMAKRGFDLESPTYIGANYWPRTHGMGSPELLRNMWMYLEAVAKEDATLDGVHGTRQRSLIFQDPLLSTR